MRDTSTSPQNETPRGHSPEAVAAFHKHLRERNRPVFIWSGFVFSALYVMWSGFDWILDPSHWSAFFALRLGAAGINVALTVWLLRNKQSLRTHEAFFGFLLIFALFIVPMLLVVAPEAFLAFSLGYSVVVIAVGLLPFWSPTWTVTLLALMVSAVMTGVLIYPPQASTQDIISAAFFLTTASMMSGFAGVSRYFLARNDFFARLELRDEKVITEKLRETDRLKDEFLANVSHELRTPLNGIIGLSESMLDTKGTLGAPSSLQNLQMIAASGRRLAGLVNDLLDFSRLKNHELTLSLKAIDIRPIVDIVVGLLTPLAKTKGIELKNGVASELPLVEADEDRLQQILLNLVGNGVKFTEKGSVEILATVVDGRLQVAVKDTGIGIAADKHEVIFESFEQADASISRDYGGTGLGLAITRKLVDLQSGELKLSSVVGEGSTFYFSLPLSDETVSANASTAVKPISLERISGLVARVETASIVVPPDGALLTGGISTETPPSTVLIVDDEPVNLQVMKAMLGPEGFRVLLTSSGAEALAVLEKGPLPDVVVLDLMMPRMSGYEVLKRIRLKHPATELPVILLTAKNQVNDLVAGFEAGANDYITKPISKGELFSRLRTHLQLTKVCTAYGRFVPHQFIRQLAHESILEVKLGDQVQKEMAVLFSDIRSFTELSEEMNPSENFNFLNSFLNRVAPVIAENQGFIDQYIGDAVMALFPNSVQNAVDAAASLRRAVRLYNTHRKGSGYRPINIGTGLHVGQLMLGTIGYEQRMQTTVVADSVNQASRLEGLTKLFGLEVLLSEAVVERMDPRRRSSVRSLGRTRVKGKRKQVTVYELLEGAPEEEMDRKLETRIVFEQGVNSLTDGEHDEAKSLFGHVLEKDPDDSAARYLMSRAEFLKNHPEARNQDGELVDRRV